MTPGQPIRADPAGGFGGADAAAADAAVERIAVRVVDGAVSADVVVSVDAPVRDLLGAALGAAPSTATRIRLVRVDAVALRLDTTVGLAGIRPGDVLVVARPGRLPAPRRARARRDKAPSPGQRLRRYAGTHPRARAGALGWVSLAAALLVGVVGARHPQGWQAAVVGVSLAAPLASVAPRLALASHPLGGIDGRPGPGEAARLVRAVHARQRRLVATASAAALAGSGLLVTSSVIGRAPTGSLAGWVLAVAGLGLAVLAAQYQRRRDRTLLTVAATSAGAGAVLTVTVTDAMVLAAVVLGLCWLATVLVLPARGPGVEVALRLRRLAGVVRTLVVATSLPLALWALGVIEAVRAAGPG